MHELLRLCPDTRCFCGAFGQDFEHLIEDCDDAFLDRRRLELKMRVKQLYLDAWGYLRAIDDNKILWHPNDIDLTDGTTYLFPPYDIPLEIRGRILHETANFYRWVMGYQREHVQLDRTALIPHPTSSESRQDSEMDTDEEGIG